MVERAVAMACRHLSPGLDRLAQVSFTLVHSADKVQSPCEISRDGGGERTSCTMRVGRGNGLSTKGLDHACLSEEPVCLCLAVGMSALDENSLAAHVKDVACRHVDVAGRPDVHASQSFCFRKIRGEQAGKRDEPVDKHLQRTLPHE